MLPAGVATVQLPCQPITDLTAGLKCNSTRCDLNTKANNYNNYQYHTWTNIDGKDMVLRMSLMPNSAGFINTYNTVRAGRYRADVYATIPYTNFSQFIAPLNRAASNARAQRLLTAKPTHLRAGLALFGKGMSTP